MSKIVTISENNLFIDMDTLLQDKSEIIQRLLYLDKTDDKHFMKKIVELYNDGIDEQTLQSIFWQRYEIEDWLRDKSLEGKDYIALYKENEKGIFRSTIYKTEDVKQVWLSTIVDEDDDVTINKPNSFKEAHMLGMEGWCFCDNEGYWIQHTAPTNQDGLGETIYFIHNVIQSNPDDYTADIVKMDGGHEILNRKHHHLNAPQYLISIGDMANKLVPISKRINDKESITVNKQDTNMKTENRNRNVVRLTESKLKQIVAESVKKALNEGEYLNNEPLFVDEPINFDDGTTSTVSMLNKEIRKQIYNAPEVQNYKIFLLKHGVSRHDIGEHLFDMYELIEKVLSQKQQQE